MVGSKSDTEEWGGVRAPPTDSNVTAESLNQYFGGISQDAHHTPPLCKSTAVDGTLEVIDEHTTYRLLTSIGRTAAGPDGLTSWFLGTTATAITKPVAYLYGVSILSSYVPPQWKISTITPVPKVTRPTKPADYRPISVTPILCRLLEKFIVRRFFHPFLLDPELNQEFADNNNNLRLISN